MIKKILFGVAGLAAVLYLGFVPDADPLGTGFRGLEVAGRAASFALP